MEADWEVEIGNGAPIIDAAWPGLVDLRRYPQLAAELSEVAHLPDLEHALLLLNAGSSLVWTAKCDVWPLSDSEEFDADEMDAPAERGLRAWGCYIDLLPKAGQLWADPAAAVSWCKAVCRRLQAVPQGCSRVDLLVRRASFNLDSGISDLDLGITAYLTSCGATSDEANRTLADALNGLVDVLRGRPTIE